VTRIRTEKRGCDESNVCNGAAYADVLRVGRGLVSFLSEDFGALKALRLSGDSYANCDADTVTKSLAEHEADAGA